MNNDDDDDEEEDDMGENIVKQAKCLLHGNVDEGDGYHNT